MCWHWFFNEYSCCVAWIQEYKYLARKSLGLVFNGKLAEYFDSFYHCLTQKSFKLVRKCYTAPESVSLPFLFFLFFESAVAECFLLISDFTDSVLRGAQWMCSCCCLTAFHNFCSVFNILPPPMSMHKAPPQWLHHTTVLFLLHESGFCFNMKISAAKVAPKIKCHLLQCGGVGGMFSVCSLCFCCWNVMNPETETDDSRITCRLVKTVPWWWEWNE